MVTKTRFRYGKSSIYVLGAQFMPWRVFGNRLTNSEHVSNCNFCWKKNSAKYGNFFCFSKDPELERIACFQLWRKDISQENWNA